MSERPTLWVYTVDDGATEHIIISGEKPKDDPSDDNYAFALVPYHRPGISRPPTSTMMNILTNVLHHAGIDTRGDE